MFKLKSFTIKSDYDPNKAKFSSSKDSEISDTYGREFLYEKIAKHILDGSSTMVNSFKELFNNLVDNYYIHVRPPTPTSITARPRIRRNQKGLMSVGQSPHPTGRSLPGAGGLVAGTPNGGLRKSATLSQRVIDTSTKAGDSQPPPKQKKGRTQSHNRKVCTRDTHLRTR